MKLSNMLCPQKFNDLQCLEIETKQIQFSNKIFYLNCEIISY